MFKKNNNNNNNECEILLKGRKLAYCSAPINYGIISRLRFMRFFISFGSH